MQTMKADTNRTRNSSSNHRAIMQDATARACPSQRDSGFPWNLIRDSLFEGRYGGHRMGKSHPVELRQRVVDHVAEGNTHRSSAARFKVSVKFVNDMVKLERVLPNEIQDSLGT